MWKVLGLFLKIVGRLGWGRWQHLYFFGHYLMGSGKTVRLSAERLLGAGGAARIVEDAQTARSRYITPAPHGTPVHKSVGKVRARRYGDTVVVLDRYMFYRTCDRAYAHGYSTCSCPEYIRRWTTWGERVRLSVTLPSLLRGWCIGEVYYERRAGLSVAIWVRSTSETSLTICVEISGSDELWADKGKPFWTVTRIKVEEGI